MVTLVGLASAVILSRDVQDGTGVDREKHVVMSGISARREVLPTGPDHAEAIPDCRREPGQLSMK